MYISFDFGVKYDPALSLRFHEIHLFSSISTTVLFSIAKKRKLAMCRTNQGSALL